MANSFSTHTQAKTKVGQFWLYEMNGSFKACFDFWGDERSSPFEIEV